MGNKHKNKMLTRISKGKKLNLSRRFTELKNYINGQWVSSPQPHAHKILSPSTQEVISTLPETSEADFNLAVANAKETFNSWGNTSVMKRQRYMQTYLALLKENQKKVAEIISEENGKTVADAMGEMVRGIEVVEHTLSFAS